MLAAALECLEEGGRVEAGGVLRGGQECHGLGHDERAVDGLRVHVAAADGVAHGQPQLGVGRVPVRQRRRRGRK